MSSFCRWTSSFLYPCTSFRLVCTPPSPVTFDLDYTLFFTIQVWMAFQCLSMVSISGGITIFPFFSLTIFSVSTPTGGGLDPHRLVLPLSLLEVQLLPWPLSDLFYIWGPRSSIVAVVLTCLSLPAGHLSASLGFPCPSCHGTASLLSVSYCFVRMLNFNRPFVGASWYYERFTSPT